MSETYTTNDIKKLIQDVLGEPVELIDDEYSEEEVQALAQQAAKHLKKNSAIKD